MLFSTVLTSWGLGLVIGVYSDSTCLVQIFANGQLYRLAVSSVQVVSL